MYEIVFYKYTILMYFYLPTDLIQLYNITKIHYLVFNKHKSRIHINLFKECKYFNSYAYQFQITSKRKNVNNCYCEFVDIFIIRFIEIALHNIISIDSRTYIKICYKVSKRYIRNN